ncbi:S8 family serine peptidase, partial [Candidatus Desantisbacteria bacterium]|nr:S8 family serine peptidase [Candidatus Desantisbacteria bacterium]
MHAHPAYKGVKPSLSGRHHYLVQFTGPIKEEWLKAVKNTGGEPREPFADFTYVVRADELILEKIKNLPFVRWIGHLPHSGRVTDSALKHADRKPGEVFSDLPRTRVIPGTYVIEFFGSDDLKKAVSAVKKAGAVVLEANPDGKVMIVKISDKRSIARKRIEVLSSIHGVRTIRERNLKRTSNDIAAKIMGANTVTANPGLNLSGKGEYIAVCDTGLDTGDPKNIHKDFSKRVSFIKSYPITDDFAAYINNPGGNDGPADLDSGHGTHVAGSVLGDGTVSMNLADVTNPIRGLAYKAKLIFQAIEQEIKWKNPGDFNNYGRFLLAGIPHDLKKLFLDAYDKKARIHSNSWGGG